MKTPKSIFVLALALVGNYSFADPATFSFSTGKLVIPQVTLSDGSQFSVVMELLPTDNLTFELTAASPFYAPASNESEYAIESSISGKFDGWDGDTIIKLANGQIWQQTGYHYEYHYAYYPKVVVYNAGAGWKMMVEGTRSAVGVTKLD
jgi:hypothetical protein